MSESKKTQDHNTIQKWVEERHGKPALVKNTRNSSDDGGVLRIKFDKSTEELKPISWDEFFKIFDEREVTFLYDADEGSTFNKFIYSNQ